MTIFTIDKEKCHQDGLCAAVCPRGIITLDIYNTHPQLVKGGEEQCIHCGHCSSVCPHGALNLKFMSVGEMAKANRANLPTSEQVKELIRTRRSTRAYKADPVDRDTVKQLIKTARYAPTARNSQLLQWLVIDTPDMLQKIKQHIIDWMQDMIDKKDPAALAYGFDVILEAWEEGRDPILRNAPGIILLHAPEPYPFGLVDSTIAMTTLELNAVTHNVATCWAGFFMIATKAWKPLRDFLDLPEGNVLTTALMIGYPRYRYTRLPDRNNPVIEFK